MTMLDPNRETEATAAPMNPSQQLAYYLRGTGAWLVKHFPEALVTTLAGFAIGYGINFLLLMFVYDGYSVTAGQLPTGQNNVKNGIFIWTLFSTVAFGLFGYRRAVGKQRFWQEMANFPQSVGAMFSKDGSQVWMHILWGLAISLLASNLVSRWAGLAIGVFVASAALSPLGRILAALITQLWRVLMNQFRPGRMAPPTGSAGLFVGLFSAALVLAAGFFVTNQKEKLIVAGVCLVLAIALGFRKPGPVTTALLVVALGSAAWMFLPAIGWADDGGFKEAGSDFGKWLTDGGIDGLNKFSKYGGVSGAAGAALGWLLGSGAGGSTPPAGGWGDTGPGRPGGGLPKGAGAGMPGAAGAGMPGAAGAAPMDDRWGGKPPLWEPGREPLAGKNPLDWPGGETPPPRDPNDPLRRAMGEGADNSRPLYDDGPVGGDNGLPPPTPEDLERARQAARDEGLPPPTQEDLERARALARDKAGVLNQPLGEDPTGAGGDKDGILNQPLGADPVSPQMPGESDFEYMNRLYREEKKRRGEDDTAECGTQFADDGPRGERQDYPRPEGIEPPIPLGGGLGPEDDEFGTRFRGEPAYPPPGLPPSPEGDEPPTPPEGEAPRAPPPEAPVSEPYPQTGRTRDKDDSLDADVGRAIANAPPTEASGQQPDDLATRDRDQSPEAQAGRDAANAPPPDGEEYVAPRPASAFEDGPGEDLTTRDRDQSPASQADRDAANAPPADDLHTREKPGTGTADGDETIKPPPASQFPGADAPADDLHTRERPGTGTDGGMGDDDAAQPQAPDQQAAPAADDGIPRTMERPSAEGDRAREEANRPLDSDEQLRLERAARQREAEIKNATGPDPDAVRENALKNELLKKAYTHDLTPEDEQEHLRPFPVSEAKPVEPTPQTEGPAPPSKGIQDLLQTREELKQMIALEKAEGGPNASSYDKLHALEQAQKNNNEALAEYDAEQRKLHPPEVDNSPLAPRPQSAFQEADPGEQTPGPGPMSKGKAELYDQLHDLNNRIAALKNQGQTTSDVPVASGANKLAELVKIRDETLDRLLIYEQQGGTAVDQFDREEGLKANYQIAGAIGELGLGAAGGEALKIGGLGPEAPTGSRPYAGSSEPSFGGGGEGPGPKGGPGAESMGGGEPTAPKATYEPEFGGSGGEPPAPKAPSEPEFGGGGGKGAAEPMAAGEGRTFEGRHDGGTQVGASDEFIPIDEPKSGTKVDAPTSNREAGPVTHDDNTLEPLKGMDARDMHDAPVSPREEWGTRLPEEGNDPFAADPHDPPIDPVTGKPFQEGGFAPSDPTAPAASKATGGDVQGPPSSDMPVEKWMGQDADWRNAPKSEKGEWGTNQPWDAPSEDSQVGRVERAGSDTKVDPPAGESGNGAMTHEESTGVPLQGTTGRQLGEIPVSPNEDWGTRLPMEDQMGIDPTDPPIDARTGKPFPEGGSPPPDPAPSPGRNEAAPSPGSDPFAATKADPLPASDDAPAENWKGQDADWWNAPKSEQGEWGTKLPKGSVGEDSQVGPVERAGSDTVIEPPPNQSGNGAMTHDESTGVPLQGTTGKNLGEVPVSPNEDWGTRLPMEDGMAVDPSDPPIDARTGKPFPEGGSPPPDPIGEARSAQGDAPVREASTPIKEDPNWLGNDADWVNSPKGKDEAWGTRTPSDPYAIDPSDPPINEKGETFPDKKGTPLPQNEMPGPNAPAQGQAGVATGAIDAGPALPAGAEPPVAGPPEAPGGSPKTAPSAEPSVTPDGQTADVKPAPKEPAATAGGETADVKPAGTKKSSAAASTDTADVKTGPDPNAPAEPPTRFSKEQQQAIRELALTPGHVPEVSPENLARYTEHVAAVREKVGGISGPCEKSQLELTKALPDDVVTVNTKLGGQINHKVVVTKEGLVLDAVPGQAVKEKLMTEGQIKAAGLWKPYKAGVFTPAQWQKFNALANRGK